jgi:3-deoxy-D-manno-octulosonic acid kinase
MQPVIFKRKSYAIAYDAGRVEIPAVEIFSPEFWDSRRALSGEAIGRGSTWFVDAPFGPVVLRQYLRGGWVAKLSRQDYFFTTVARSRPFREFDILARLSGQGLPVPRPLAALCEHRGLISTGSIITARIAGARTLADFFPGNRSGPEPDAAFWQSVGKCIRQFHNAGAWHADLNARNILLDDEMRVHLVDFDRAHFTPGKPVNGKRNLERLKRSLEKLWPAANVSEMQAAWLQLRAGYHG